MNRRRFLRWVWRMVGAGRIRAWRRLLGSVACARIRGASSTSTGRRKRSRSRPIIVAAFRPWYARVTSACSFRRRTAARSAVRRFSRCRACGSKQLAGTLWRRESRCCRDPRRADATQPWCARAAPGSPGPAAPPRGEGSGGCRDQRLCAGRGRAEPIGIAASSDRWRERARMGSGLPEPIANPEHRLDVGRVSAVVAQLLPQGRDAHVDDPGPHVRTIPHPQKRPLPKALNGC